MTQETGQKAEFMFHYITDPTGQSFDEYLDSPQLEPPWNHRVECKCLRKTKHPGLNEDSLPLGLRLNSDGNILWRLYTIGAYLFDKSQAEEPAAGTSRPEMVVLAPKGMGLRTPLTLSQSQDLQCSRGSHPNTQRTLIDCVLFKKHGWTLGTEISAISQISLTIIFSIDSYSVGHFHHAQAVIEKATPPSDLTVEKLVFWD